MQINTVSFIGSGNVATHLVQVFFNRGIIVKQICSRVIENATVLAKKVNAIPIDHIQEIDEDVDLIFCCTKDDLILKISNKLIQSKSIRRLVHTSGTVGLEVFNPIKHRATKVGIFYPLQTFSKTAVVDFSVVPIGITTDHASFETELIHLAQLITPKAFVINDADRQHLHLSAVLVNNFVNHLFAIAQHYCRENKLDFNLLKPLIHQTINKIDTINPIDAQTGPAKRHDTTIIEKHIQMLNNDVLTKNIYKALTDSIIEMYK